MQNPTPETEAEADETEAVTTDAPASPAAAVSGVGSDRSPGKDPDFSEDAGAETLASIEKVRFALVRGEPLLKLPEDLYIPPDALEVFLDTFEGPLDLLLYLIRRQNLDILDIPIIDITNQYMEYVELMKEVRLELAAEYLVMAAMLCEIKSRMLLPRADEDAEDDEDPRAELVRRLAEYEQFKRAAQDLDALPRLERDCFLVQARVPPGHVRRTPPTVELDELLAALQAVLARADLFTSHQIERESLSLRERMSAVLERISGAELVPFTDLFDVTEGRAGVVVSFLAVLELLKAATLELIQVEPFAPIRLRRRGMDAA
ncbi:MAG: segregation/condensation protein A [Chromatiaceae bacterium]|nr:segregation/condensation protein A [Chromatiaceae bacterium]MCF7994966.1 segregation/condensation protein A [Chromatiaceae bacterium]MCF8015528.1 segregation/condensation protein A [Chromatiaceae bacterium]